MLADAEEPLLDQERHEQRRDAVLPPPPRTSNRPFKVLLIFFYESAFLPTKLAFHRTGRPWESACRSPSRRVPGLATSSTKEEVAGESPWTSTWHCASLHVPGQP